MQATEWVSDTALFFNLFIKQPKDSVYGEVISVPQKSVANCLAYRRENNSNSMIIKINDQDLQNTFSTRKELHTKLLSLRSTPDYRSFTQTMLLLTPPSPCHLTQLLGRKRKSDKCKQEFSLSLKTSYIQLISAFDLHPHLSDVKGNTYPWYLSSTIPSSPRCNQSILWSTSMPSFHNE